MTKRIRNLSILIEAANRQTDEWLIGFLRDATLMQSRKLVLSRLACLRILAWRRAGSGLTYIERKRLVRREIGA